MEFTNIQNSQLKQLKDMVKLQKLQAKCEKIKGELDSLVTESTQCLSQREKLMEQLAMLQKERDSARNQELHWQQKLEAASKTFVYHDNNHLQSLCSILGYQISDCQLIENNGIKITLYYRDVCSVTYCQTVETFDLIEIFPHHFNFAKIQQFLQTSQDMAGLLACLRKFFDLALELKQREQFVENLDQN